MARLRLGVVGTGAIAARHLRAIADDAMEVVVVAHLGRNPARTEAAATAWGGAAFVDLDRFLAEGRPDAVLITVPRRSTVAIERALIEARIPFLVEKPIALDLATAEDIAARVDAAGLVAAAGFQWRAMDTIDLVRSLVAERPVRMALGKFHIGTPPSPWWRREAESGGQMLEQACHLVDIARLLCGEAELVGAVGSFAPLPQYPDGDVAGASAALLRFASGAPGVITATCILPGSSRVEMRLIADELEIVVDLRGIDVIRNGVATRHELHSVAYARQDRAFFDAVRAGNPRQVFCTYADALQTHRLCLAIRDEIRRRA